MEVKKYRIKRADGKFSKGVVVESWIARSQGNSGKAYTVRWDAKKGKEWTSEKLLKKHLLNCLEKGIFDESWEIVEVVMCPTKPINDWIDSQMLVKYLKGKA